MKKKNIIILIMTLLLNGCSNNEFDLKIITPTGAPSVCFYTEIENNNYETNSSASNIIAFMSSSNTYDVLVVDTLSGIKTINKGANYKLAATITFGNFFLVATDENRTEEIKKEDRICIFGQGQTPDIIFQYLYGNEYDNVEYVNNVQTAASVFKLKKNVETENSIDFVLLAEPLYTSLTMSSSNSYLTYDLNSMLKEKDVSIFQASVFVSNEANKKEIDKYLNNLEKNINNLLNDSSLLDNYFSNDELVKQIYGVNKNVIKNTLKNNSMNLGFKLAKNYKTEIDKYIALFGMDKTNEEIYF